MCAETPMLPPNVTCAMICTDGTSTSRLPSLSKTTSSWKGSPISTRSWLWETSTCQMWNDPCGTIASRQLPLTGPTPTHANVQYLGGASFETSKLTTRMCPRKFNLSLFMEKSYFFMSYHPMWIMAWICPSQLFWIHLNMWTQEQNVYDFSLMVSLPLMLLCMSMARIPNFCFASPCFCTTILH